MKRLAEGQEPIVRIPVVLEPVEVEVPLATVAIEIADVAVAVRVLPDRAKCLRYHPCHHPSIP